MKILSDFHHQSLYKSLQLLLEKRLGHTLYRPIGMDWYHKGYWDIYPSIDTAKQFLELGYIPKDGTNPLNVGIMDSDGDIQNTITLDEFKSMEFDILIASIPQHIEPFRNLIKNYQPNAKLIVQMGNNWPLGGYNIDNLLASTSIKTPDSMNAVQYHQEFDTEKYFYYDDSVVSHESIVSFLNVIHLTNDWPLFQELTKELPEYTFKAFGGQCPDGSLVGHKALADEMRKAKFIWQVKHTGDGYGHILFNSAAVGRPCIVKKSYYSGMLGEKLLIDDKTCINIDGLSTAQIVDKIKYFSDPDRYKEMCKNVYDNFNACVNFKEDAEKVNKFLQNLK